MTKTLTNFAFIVASLIIILVFVTSKTYSQLVIAVVLYPTLVFLAFMIFPRRGLKSPKLTIQEQPKLNSVKVDTSKPKTEPAIVADIDRRAFIKLIGATGISFFLFSLLGRRIEPLIFGRSGTSGINPISSTGGNQVGPAQASPTDGYKISEIDEGPVTYYGFIDKAGAWLIMREEADGSSFRYAKGSSGFPGSWANRENLRYDYFNNAF